mmetsp:Transcript_13419/g.17506  ORF Transcript_13419/g.17506 Transcript_13419/m.17506 type:complete len:100 (+) Transcript_13419:197-496(+)
MLLLAKLTHLDMDAFSSLITEDIFSVNLKLYIMPTIPFPKSNPEGAIGYCKGLGIEVLNQENLSTTTDFIRQHACSPSGPANLSNPECFTPPNGRACTK